MKKLIYNEKEISRFDIVHDIKNALKHELLSNECFNLDCPTLTEWGTHYPLEAVVVLNGTPIANAYTIPWIKRSSDKRETLVVDFYRFGRMSIEF